MRTLTKVFMLCTIIYVKKDWIAPPKNHLNRDFSSLLHKVKRFLRILCALLILIERVLSLVDWHEREDAHTRHHPASILQEKPCPKTTFDNTVSQYLLLRSIFSTCFLSPIRSQMIMDDVHPTTTSKNNRYCQDEAIVVSVLLPSLTDAESYYFDKPSACENRSFDNRRDSASSLVSSSMAFHRPSIPLLEESQLEALKADLEQSTILSLQEQQFSGIHASSLAPHFHHSTSGYISFKQNTRPHRRVSEVRDFNTTKGSNAQGEKQQVDPRLSFGSAQLEALVGGEDQELDSLITSIAEYEEAEQMIATVRPNDLRVPDSSAIVTPENISLLKDVPEIAFAEGLPIPPRLSKSTTPTSNVPSSNNSALSYHQGNKTFPSSLERKYKKTDSMKTSPIGSTRSVSLASTDHLATSKNQHDSRFREYQEEQWMVRFAELQDFVKTTNQHFVPYDYPGKSALARWTKRQVCL